MRRHLSPRLAGEIRPGACRSLGHVRGHHVAGRNQRHHHGSDRCHQPKWIDRDRQFDVNDSRRQQQRGYELHLNNQRAGGPGLGGVANRDLGGQFVVAGFALSLQSGFHRNQPERGGGRLHNSVWREDRVFRRGQRLFHQWQACGDSGHVQPSGPCGGGFRPAGSPPILPHREA